MTAAEPSPNQLNWNRRILGLAGPIVLANLSIPLLGIVDTAVVGHLPESTGLGAVALGALIFSTVLFVFGFLRMSTTGLTAQADGAENPTEVQAVLYRAGGIALGFGIVVLALQGPFGHSAFLLTEASPDVEALGLLYFDIRIWGAPAALLNMALLGWLFGFGSMRHPVILQIAINGINIVLDLLFVFGFSWGVGGVATATLIAEWSGTVLGVGMAIGQLRRRGDLAVPRSVVLDSRHIRRLFGVNRDILIRSLSMLLVLAHFKITGASFGTLTLAANTVLLIFFEIAAYGLDAFANAAEILIGKAISRRDRQAFDSIVRLAFCWAVGIALVNTAVFYLAGSLIVAGITDQPDVQETGALYLFWAAAIPATAVWAFVYDGIFIGATRTTALRNGMLASVVIYFLSQWILVDAYQNHGLWAALHIFVLARAVTLAAQHSTLARSINA